MLEGYGPPPDPRLTQLVVTPDPGVIEVNVQPTASWAEQRELTTTLYDAARHAGLTTEKFDLDGLHTGTGGGNHITLGGTQPVDSPLLRRPDLLVSLITYWQRHPSLSYLFSGRFIGPTSQAPRFDEGRPEAVYEMEIASAEIARLVGRGRRDGEAAAVAGRPRAAAPAHRPDRQHPPRRVLHRQAVQPRLLARPARPARAARLRDAAAPADGAGPGAAGAQPGRDVLGAAADRAAGALGHPRCTRTSCCPQGAIRDIARGRRRPARLRHRRSRSPGSTRSPSSASRGSGWRRLGDGIELELRAAIEPWHVLGEEATAGGTARYVDSSVERLQVLVRGIDPHAAPRHVPGCARAPDRRPAAPASYYAGVRYRAWQPWSALHPSIEVHAPLRFDVVDIASATSLGGATYHVVHPGGRSYDHPPVNAQEAEARRASRFEPRGHTAGPARRRRRCARPAGAPRPRSTRTPSTCGGSAGRPR